MSTAKAGKIVIDISAGTAQFMVDMDKANSKLKEFGSHAVSNQQAASAALRTLKGDFTNNLRAAEAFLGTTLGLGDALKKAFPVVGAVAMLGVFTELGEAVNKALEALKKMQEAPARITQEFTDLNQSIRLTNDQLLVANARLENQIAKIEGKPQNGLKVALLEAIEAADQLAESLNKDFESVQKLMEQEQIGQWKGFFTGNASTADLTDQFKSFRQRMTELTIDTNNRADATNDPKAKAAIFEEATRQRSKALADETKVIKDQLAAAQALQKQRDNWRSEIVGFANGSAIYSNPGARPSDQGTRIAELEGVLANLQQLATQTGYKATNATLTGRLDALKADRENADARKPVDDYLASLREANDAAQRAAQSVATNPFGEAEAKGFEAASKAIGELNRKLAEHKQALTDTEKIEIIAQNARKVMIDLSAKVREEDKRRDDAAQLGANAIASSIDAENAKRRQLLQTIGEEWDAAEALIQAQSKGADAVWQAQEKIRLAKIQDPDVRAATEGRDNAERTASIEAQVTAINREAEANDRLAAAVLGGVQAKRQAELENIRTSGAPAAEIEAQLNAAQSRYRLEDAQNLKNAPLSAGVRSYFTDMVDNAKSAAMQVKEVLNSTFESVNDTLARAISGQKVSWASMFQGLSAQIAKLGIENAEVAIVKKVGGMIGGGGAGQQGNNRQPWDEKPTFGGVLGGGVAGKRDGSTESSAIYVQVVGATPGAGSGESLAGDIGKSGAATGISAVVGKLFGGFAGFRAEGGSVDPGHSYIVGEKGPELWTPPSGGTIVPNHKLNGGGAFYSIDARGADEAAVEQRVQRALTAVHGSAVRNAAAVQAEMQKRKPK